MKKKEFLKEVSRESFGKVSNRILTYLFCKLRNKILVSVSLVEEMRMRAKSISWTAQEERVRWEERAAARGLSLESEMSAGLGIYPAQRDWFRDRDVIQSKVMNPKETSQVLFSAVATWETGWKKFGSVMDGVSTENRANTQRQG